MANLISLLTELLKGLFLKKKREKLIRPKHVPVKNKKEKITNHIWCNNQKVEIDWPKVVTYKEDPKWDLPKSCMRTSKNSRAGRISKFVIHWDGCLDSEMCYRVLKSRGLSVHFCIDNDGTIIQLMDTNDVAWHARGVNTESIGVEISNAVYMKYSDKYDPPRPVWDNVSCHGREIGPILGFTEEQIKATKVLAKTICEEYKIPFVVPLNENGELIRGVIGASALHPKGWKSYRGVMGHYHLNKGKTDPAGLDLKEVIKDETK